MPKNSLPVFPKIKNADKILILAPHIDDEIISSAGIIQQAVKMRARVLVVYATCGDNVSSFLLRKILSKKWFIGLGKKRMAEARQAVSLIGLKRKNLVFLGYPDNGLKQMLKNPSASVSKSTHLNYNPYQGTFRKKQFYVKENLLKDLAEIVFAFKPTLVIVPHGRDRHTDHSALFSFWREISLGIKTRCYSYLVHFPSFPKKKDSWLWPPQQLLASGQWHSYILTQKQLSKKLAAISQNKSQQARIPKRNFLKNFAAKNEIFEKL